MSAKQSAARKRNWEAGRYRHRKQVRAYWAEAVVRTGELHNRFRTRITRWRWMIACDQLRSD